MNTSLKDTKNKCTYVKFHPVLFLFSLSILCLLSERWEWTPWKCPNVKCLEDLKDVPPAYWRPALRSAPPRWRCSRCALPTPTGGAARNNDTYILKAAKINVCSILHSFFLSWSLYLRCLCYILEEKRCVKCSVMRQSVVSPVWNSQYGSQGFVEVIIFVLFRIDLLLVVSNFN